MATTSSISGSIFTPIFFYIDDNQCIWTPAVYNNTFAKEHLLTHLHANSDFFHQLVITCLAVWPAKKVPKVPKRQQVFCTFADVSEV
jgi:hypothetical protein